MITKRNWDSSTGFCQMDQAGLKCCVLALGACWTITTANWAKLNFIMYGGILTLTHLYHYWHIPTMVGFCHGGNMLGNPLKDVNQELVSAKTATKTWRANQPISKVVAALALPEVQGDHGLPAYSHHDKIPPWWECVSNDKGGNVSVSNSHHSW